jgi:hypothetical protein
MKIRQASGANDAPAVKRYREPTGNDVKNGPIKCDYREWPWLKWKTGTLVRLTNRSGRSPYVIIKDGDEIAYQHCRIEEVSE